MPTTLGERIRQARTAYGMSQAELARRIGISGQAMYQIENGKTPDPQASRITMIAQVLGVSADYLLGLIEEEEGPSWPPRRRRQARAGAS